MATNVEINVMRISMKITSLDINSIENISMNNIHGTWQNLFVFIRIMLENNAVPSLCVRNKNRCCHDCRWLKIKALELSTQHYELGCISWSLWNHCGVSSVRIFKQVIYLVPWVYNGFTGSLAFTKWMMTQPDINAGVHYTHRPRARLNIKIPSYQYRSWYRLIFNMGISIPRKNGLYIETGPCIWVMICALL